MDKSFEGELPWLVGAVHTWSSTPWDRPLLAEPSLMARLDSIARTDRQRPAITQAGDHGDAAITYTYGALLDHVNSRARELREGGIGRDSCVRITMHNTISAVVDLLAIVKCDGAALILERLDTPIGVDVATHEIPAIGGAPEPRMPRQSREAAMESPYATRFIIPTTGSTSEPRLVAQSEYAIVLNAWSVGGHHSLDRNTRMGCPLPLSHVNGLEFGLLAVLLRGGHVLLFGQFDPLTFLRVARDAELDIITAVPSVLHALSQQRSWPSLPHLRYFVSAASRLDSSLAENIYAFDETRVVQGYGLTETMNFSATMPYDLSRQAYEEVMLRSEIPPVGIPIFGCELRCLTGDNGDEILVRGHSVMNGYLDSMEDTVSAFEGGWFHTGDLGRFVSLPDGQSALQIVGRLKNVAKCGGLTVSLEAIERAVQRVAGMDECCAVSRFDQRRGEAITLFVVGEAEPEAVASSLQPMWSAPQLGLRLVNIDLLPRLRSGKVDRRSLAQMDAAKRP